MHSHNFYSQELMVAVITSLLNLSIVSFCRGTQLRKKENKQTNKRKNNRKKQVLKGLHGCLFLNAKYLLLISMSLRFESFSFSKQSDFAEQLLHHWKAFSSYLLHPPPVDAFLFFTSWHCPLSMLIKNVYGKTATFFGLHYFLSFPS